MDAGPACWRDTLRKLVSSWGSTHLKLYRVAARELRLLASGTEGYL